MTRQPALPAHKAFAHVVYDHRYLALASFAWREFGQPGSSDALDTLVPGSGALLQDSVLLHARALIEFYLPRNPSPTDIVLDDFGLPAASKQITARLEPYRRPIEVHLGHITAWRDPDYRQKNAGSAVGAERQRPDWNIDNAIIIDSLLDALGEMAQSNVPWSEAFGELHHASMAAVRDPKTGWPAHLSESVDVEQYVQRLGLA